MKRASAKVIPVAFQAPTTVDMEFDDAIVAIYEKYNTGLQTYLRRHLNSKEDIEDVSQEVYLRLIKLNERNEIDASLALLCKIASNLIIDRFRSQRIRQTHAHAPIDECELKSPDASPEEVVKSREWMVVLRDTLYSLNEDCRTAFILHRFKGLTYRQIAKKMGISKGMVSKHISYVLLKLDKKLRKYL